MKAVFNRCGVLSACIAILSTTNALAQDAAPPPKEVPGAVPYVPAPDGNSPNNSTPVADAPVDANSPALPAPDGTAPPTAPLPTAPTPAAPAQDAAQRREAQRLAQERRMRELMVGFGVVDTQVQDALLAHIGAQVRARARVRQLGVELYQALRRPKLADEDVRRLLADYQTALEADSGERGRAEEALDARIHFRDQPRLEAMLMLFGIIGDNPVIMPFGLNRSPNRRGTEARPRNNGAAGARSSTAPKSQQSARLSAPDVSNTNRVVTAEKRSEDGETIVGIIVGQRDDGLEVRLDDGTTRRFLPRAVAPDGNLDGEMLRVLATFEIGQRVRLRWIDEDEPRVIAIGKVEGDQAP